MLEFDSWRRTSPLAVLFFLGRGVKAFAGNLPQLAGTAGFLVILARESLWAALLGGAALIVLVLAVAALDFWRFRFKLAADRVLIREGVFRHRELTVQFARIQGVHIEQSLLFRLLDLATVSFDTAGSAQREGHLPAVSTAFAAALRDRIESLRAHPEQPVAETTGPHPPLVHLTNGDLVRVGLTDPSVLTGLLFVPVLLQNDDLREAATRGLGIVATAVEGQVVVAASGALAVLAALLVAATIASAFLRYHNFELRFEGSALRARGGLLTRKQSVLERSKIQQLTLTQNPAMRLFRRYRLRALPARSGQARDRSTGQALPGATLTVPLLDAQTAAQLRATMLAGEAGEAGPLSLLPSDGFAPVSAYWLRLPLVAGGVLPTAVAVPILVQAFGPVGWAALAWPLVVAPLAWLAWRRRGYAYNGDALAIRSGLFGQRVETCLFRKAQAVAVRRSPLQRRTGLATLDVQLASGGASVPFIPYATACALRDTMLYKAEASRRPWH